MNFTYLSLWIDYSDVSEFNFDTQDSIYSTTTTSNAKTTRIFARSVDIIDYSYTNVPNESSIFEKIRARSMKSSQLYKEMTILLNTTTFTTLQDQTTPLKPFGFIDMIDAYISQK